MENPHSRDLNLRLLHSRCLVCSNVNLLPLSHVLARSSIFLKKKKYRETLKTAFLKKEIHWEISKKIALEIKLMYSYIHTHKHRGVVSVRPRPWAEPSATGLTCTDNSPKHLTWMTNHCQLQMWYRQFVKREQITRIVKLVIDERDPNVWPTKLFSWGSLVPKK